MTLPVPNELGGDRVPLGAWKLGNGLAREIPALESHRARLGHDGEQLEAHLLGLQQLCVTLEAAWDTMDVASLPP